MTIIIDKPKAIELLERAVAEKGADYVYPKLPTDPGKSTCNYVRENKPSCIAGHVLFYANPDIRMLDLLEGAGTIGGYIQKILREEYDLVITDDAVQVMWCAQRCQDTEHAWGDSVRRAVEVANGERPSYQLLKP